VAVIQYKGKIDPTLLRYILKIVFLIYAIRIMKKKISIFRLDEKQESSISIDTNGDQSLYNLMCSNSVLLFVNPNNHKIWVWHRIPERRGKITFIVKEIIEKYGFEFEIIYKDLTGILSENADLFEPHDWVNLLFAKITEDLEDILYEISNAEKRGDIKITIEKLISQLSQKFRT